MSTSFYKLSPPSLLWKTSRKVNNKSIEIWSTTCIVTNFGKNQNITNCGALVNPANPELSGVSAFTYFPRGGPVPKVEPKSAMHKNWQPLGYVSNWGGMEVGSGMLYPASVVDGLVHRLGGNKLALECKLKKTFFGGCPTGTAVSTSYADEALSKIYEHIIHTAPPFYNDKNSIELLHKCYRAAFAIAFEKSNKVACPLIGAGARGFPIQDAITVAVKESLAWRDNDDEYGIERVLLFGIPDANISGKLVEKIRAEESS